MLCSEHGSPHHPERACAGHVVVPGHVHMHVSHSVRVLYIDTCLRLPCVRVTWQLTAFILHCAGNAQRSSAAVLVTHQAVKGGMQDSSNGILVGNCSLCEHAL